jgi:RNA polymerase sigma factor (sigma-70 family)
VSPDSIAIQPLLDELRRGNAAALARLTAVTYNRLRLLAAKMVNESFPALRGVHDSDSVFNAVYLRLHTALSKMAAAASTPPTPADYFRFAAFKIRQALLDMVGADRRRMATEREFPDDQDGSILLGPDGLVQAPDPPPEVKVAWAEFLARVDALPDPQRDVFHMHFLMDVPQAQIAAELRLTAKQVSREWLKACQAVGKFLPG